MPRFSRSDIVVAVLVVGAIALRRRSALRASPTIPSNSLLVRGLVAGAARRCSCLRCALPLRGGGSRLSAWVTTALIAAAAIAVVIAANVALFRHDVHFDVTREGRNTPPAQLTDVIDHLRAPLSLTYFYNTGDANAIAGEGADHDRGATAIRCSRSAPSISTRSRGLRATSACTPTTPRCCKPATARCWSKTSPMPRALAMRRCARFGSGVETICFITGHGETFRPTPAHFHYSHVETLRGHDTPGAGDVLVAEPEQLDRFQLALNEIGFEMRGIVTAAANSIPSDCAVVADDRSANGIRRGRSGLAGQVSGGWRQAAAADRSSVSRRSRIAKLACSARSAYRPSPPSSSTP